MTWRNSIARPVVCVVALAALICVGGCPSGESVEQTEPPPAEGGSLVDVPAITGSAVSPDGRYVAVAAMLGSELRQALAVVALPAGNRVAMLSGASPSWDAGGEALYFSDGPVAHSGNIWRYDVGAGSTGAEGVGGLPPDSTNVAASPARAEIAVVTLGRPHAVFLCDPAGEQCSELLSWERVLGASLTWSPDGSRLFLIRRDKQAEFPAAELVSVAVPSGELTVLAQGPLSFPVQAAPDGTVFCTRYTDLDDRRKELVQVGPEAGLLTVIRLPRQVRHLEQFAVSADGAHILAGDAGGGLWLVARSDGGAQQVSANGMAPQWLPDAPEGYIFFEPSNQDGVSQLVLMRGSIGGEAPSQVAAVSLAPDSAAASP
ncbi:MAG: hypothetical protein AB7Y46_05930 [Armatimonadota bacterium]